MSSTETVRSTVCLEPDLHQALRLKAAHSQRIMSGIENESLRQALREDQEDLSALRGRAKERALSFEDFLANPKPDSLLAALVR